MDVWAALLVGLAVSVDGFMVGIAYGFKRIRLPQISLLVITLASVSAVTISMLCGKGLTMVLPSGTAHHLGAVLLIGLGLYFMLSAFREKLDELDHPEEAPLLTLNIKVLGIIVQILKEPARADFDDSGEIGIKEAFFLGLALSMDAFGAGIGLAMTGINIFYTAVSVGMVKFILVNSGIYLGRCIAGERFKNLVSIIPGLILIGIGLFEIL